MSSSRADLPRTIGFWGASAVMVGVIIGSGIFRQPTEIARHLGSPWLILAFWAVGGVISLFGALTYAELATMFPQTGGVYVFLREGYGRAVAFTFGWTYMLITKPFAAGAIATIFSEHVNTVIGWRPEGWLKVWAAPLETCALLIMLTAVNVLGTSLGAGVAMALTGLKLAALAAIIVAATLLGQPSFGALATVDHPQSLLLAIAPVMSGVLWTYDGWSDVGAVAGEVRNPQRMLPRIYFAGTLAVTLLYLAVNASFFFVAPLTDMRTTATLAPMLMERLLGAGASVAVTLVVVVSTFGSTHSSILTGARVTFAQARDGLLFRFLARVHPRRHTPDIALWTQCALSCIAVLFLGGFSQLADGFVFTMWIFYGLAGAAIFILRARLPGADRPYRCWGYPVVPALFVCAAVAMTALSIQSNPAQTLPWLCVILAGIPVYYIWNRLTTVSPRG